MEAGQHIDSIVQQPEKQTVRKPLQSRPPHAGQHDGEVQGICDNSHGLVINLGTATSYTLTEAAFPLPPYGVEMAAIRLRAAGRSSNLLY